MPRPCREPPPLRLYRAHHPQGSRIVSEPFGDPVFAELWALLESTLFVEQGSAELFNPYRYAATGLDRPDAPVIRKDNLRRYLAAYSKAPPLLLLAEAPGPWGCRFSGVPITSEAQLVDPGFPLSGCVSAADGVPHTEYSAGIFWRLLGPVFPRFFVWNAVPLHPHDAGDPLSIRTPRPSELRRFEDLTSRVVGTLAPRRVLAVGRKAEQVLSRIGVPASYVRHPSQGGANLFAEGVRRALDDLDTHDGQPV